jgi:hypothetical protein
MFLVYIFDLSGYAPCPKMIWIPSLLLTRDSATYSWPCEKTGLGKYQPIFSRVCPRALLILIAKAGYIGYYDLCKGNGNPESDKIRGIRGIKTLSPMLVPVLISASITCWPKPRTIIWVPFTCRLDPFICRNSIIGAPTLSTNLTNLCGGPPEGSSVLRNSVGYWKVSISSGTESTLKNTCSLYTPQKVCDTDRLQVALIQKGNFIILRLSGSNPQNLFRFDLFSYSTISQDCNTASDC